MPSVFTQKRDENGKEEEEEEEANVWNIRRLVSQCRRESSALEESVVEETRQAMYVERNNEARSRNHCYRGKAVSITYLCVCVCGA